jgi:anti-sigma regulatory factor (Ser/Thr protein kinase)
MQARLTVRADADAMRELEGFVAAFATERGIDDGDAARIGILLEELLTNLVKYGYPDGATPGLADIGLDLDGNRLTIEFADDGRAFNPLAQPAPDLDLPLEDRQEGGLGIHILRALTEEAHYTRRHDRNVVRLIRRVALIP